MDLLMREVTSRDSIDLLEWRNEPKVRSFSRNKSIISENDHSTWFTRRLEVLGKEPFWIFESSIRKIGFVRFDLDETLSQFEISLTVNPIMRGKGYGRIILQRAIDECLIIHQNANLCAFVHKNNIASKILFRNCGFEEFENQSNFLTFKRAAKLY